MIRKDLVERLRGIESSLDNGDINHAQTLLYRLMAEVQKPPGTRERRLTIHLSNRLSALASDLAQEVEDIYGGEEDA